MTHFEKLSFCSRGNLRWFLCALLLLKIIFSMKWDLEVMICILIVTFSVKRNYESIFRFMGMLF